MATLEFARAILRMSIAQLCKSKLLECDGIEESACETLVDMLQQYIEELGSLAHCYAEHAGRSETNFNDVEQALHDWGVSLKNIMVHLSSGEVPLTKPLPRFPTLPPAKRRKINITTFQRPEYIPAFLPAFPDQHSFKETPVYINRERERVKIRQKKNKERELMESNLTKLHNQINNATQIANYDNPVVTGLPISDLIRTREYKVSGRNSSIEATPIEKDSPFLLSLYTVPAEQESQTDPAKPTEEEEKDPEKIKEKEKEKEKEKDKLKHIEKILSLKHKDNVVEQIEMEASVAVKADNDTSTSVTPSTAGAIPKPKAGHMSYPVGARIGGPLIMGGISGPRSYHMGIGMPLGLGIPGMLPGMGTMRPIGGLSGLTVGPTPGPPAMGPNLATGTTVPTSAPNPFPPSFTSMAIVPPALANLIPPSPVRTSAIPIPKPPTNIPTIPGAPFVPPFPQSQNQLPLPTQQIHPPGFPVNQFGQQSK